MRESSPNEAFKIDAKLLARIRRNSEARKLRAKRPINWKLLRKRLGRYVSKKRAEDITFDLGELVDICSYFPAMVFDLFQSLHTADKNAVWLHNRALVLSGELEHFQYHINKLSDRVFKLARLASKLPSMKSLTKAQLQQ